MNEGKKQIICEECLKTAFSMMAVSTIFTVLGIVDAIYSAVEYGTFWVTLLVAILAVAAGGIGFICGILARIFADKKSSIWNMITFSCVCLSLGRFLASLYTLFPMLLW